MTQKLKKPDTAFFAGLASVLSIGISPWTANLTQPMPRFVATACSIMGALYLLFRLARYIHRFIDEVDKDRITNQRLRYENQIFQKEAFLEIDKKIFDFEMQKDQWRTKISQADMPATLSKKVVSTSDSSKKKKSQDVI